MLENNKLSFGAQYISCGIYSQSYDKIEKTLSVKPANLIGQMIVKNINFIGNCLGSSENLQEGLKEIISYKNKVIIDSVFDDKDSIRNFIEKSFSKKDRFGKVVYLY